MLSVLGTGLFDLPLIISAQHGQGFVDKLDGTAQGGGPLFLLLRQRAAQDL